MANRVLCAASCLLKSFGRLSVQSPSAAGPSALVRTQLPAALSVRHTSFFNKRTYITSTGIGGMLAKYDALQPV